MIAHPNARDLRSLAQPPSESNKSKKEVRIQMLALRNAISESERKQKGEEIMQKLFALDEFKSAKCIALYISKGSEVATLDMIKKALSLDKEILVPHTDHEIELVKFTSFEDLAPARFGILEPKTKIRSEKAPDIIIVPGLSFDLDLHRLGYGKGHYDKLLKTLNSIRIGVCFDMQIIEKIPRHEHDERLDIVISEKRLLIL